MDIVYTWVNGADAAHQELLKRFAKKSKKLAAAHRFSCNEELKFSLRSLEKFAPWHNRVFLVTNGQLPAWLDTSAPGLAIISHDEIFTRHVRSPTFNSHVIDHFLYRIPDISRHFIYFNDDFLLGAEVSPDDFIQGDRVKLYLEDYGVKSLVQAIEEETSLNRLAQRAKNLFTKNKNYTSAANTKLWVYSMNYVNEKFAGRYGERERNPVCHIPYSIDSKIVESLNQEWKYEINEILEHRFRTERDFAFIHAYAHFAQDYRNAEGQPAFSPAVIYKDQVENLCQELRLGASTQVLLDGLEEYDKKQHKFLSCQSQLGLNQEVSSLFKAQMQQRFPKPSRYEN